jgi:cell wall assembly regulator SMI1
MASVKKSWQVIERVLWKNCHSVSLALRKPASSATLAKLQKRFRNRVPRAFLESLKTHDGLRKSYLDEIRLFNYWALLPVDAILMESKMMYEIEADLQSDSPDMVTGPKRKRAKNSTAQMRNDIHWSAGWIPFMDADGDKLVIDLDPGPKGTVGQILYFSNSEGAKRVIAPSFETWLSRLADILSSRDFKLDEDGGIETGLSKGLD